MPFDLGFELTPLRMELESDEGLPLPGFAGHVFRGAFGWILRELVCIAPHIECADCNHRAVCPYQLIFESAVVPEEAKVLRKYPYAPHPFVLAPVSGSGTDRVSAKRVTLDLTLIGRGKEYLSFFIAVMEEMGSRGRLGSKFRLRAVRPAMQPKTLVYDGLSRTLFATPQAWMPDAVEKGVERVQLEFLTPLRMRTGGVYNRQPDFVAIVHALLRRIHLLRAVYGSGGPETDWMRPLLQQADRVRTQERRFQLFDLDRYSRRQQTRIPMDGVAGRIVATGELDELMPYLQAGEWLNVGSGTALGLGKYRIRKEAQA